MPADPLRVALASLPKSPVDFDTGQSLTELDGVADVEMLVTSNGDVLEMAIETSQEIHGIGFDGEQWTHVTTAEKEGEPDDTISTVLDVLQAWSPADT